jgi:hypothetical protein
VVRRDLRLALRKVPDSIMVVTFFVLTVVLFPSESAESGMWNGFCRHRPVTACWPPAVLDRLFRPITRTARWNCWSDAGSLRIVVAAKVVPTG